MAWSIVGDGSIGPPSAHTLSFQLVTYMAQHFEKFAQTPDGKALAAIIDNPAMTAAYRALSARGRPAIQAVVEAAAALIAAAGDEKQADFRKQFCGYWVGQAMRKMGYKI